MSLAMSAEERQAFLAGVHVGVLSVADAGRGPWLVPIWYGYEPGGDVWIITGADSRKTALIRAAGRCSLCVQTEEPPYRYLTVEGPAAIGGRVTAEERRALARRYLGDEQGDAYVVATADIAEHEVVISLRPERWLSADYSRM